MLHIDITEEEISRKADEDNENDEYHVKVSDLDKWQEYHRLKTEEGWSLEDIAKTKGTQKSHASERINLHTKLCEAAKKACSDKLSKKNIVLSF